MFPLIFRWRRSAETPLRQSRTTKPRPACQSIRFPAGANVAPAFGHDAGGLGEISGINADNENWDVNV
jgi:hypothetical protein